MDAHYREGNQPVLAIFFDRELFKICLPTRGGARGEPILVGANLVRGVVYFESQGVTAEKG